MIIVRPRYRGYNATEEFPEGWDFLQDITACIPSNIKLEARSGPDADVIKITESGHQFEGRSYRVVSMDRREILGVIQNKFFLRALTRDDAY